MGTGRGQDKKTRRQERSLAGWCTVTVRRSRFVSEVYSVGINKRRCAYSVVSLRAILSHVRCTCSPACSPARSSRRTCIRRRSQEAKDSKGRNENKLKRKTLQVGCNGEYAAFGPRSWSWRCLLSSCRLRTYMQTLTYDVHPVS